MRFSKMFIPTVREDPAEAEVVSHKLMIRSGMIRRITTGVYAYLPVGMRSLRKLQQIIREELNRVGGNEVLMPQVHPAELWKESGRWEEYGKELLRFQDRHNRDYCLGPTHEEVATDIMRHFVKSYRDLPQHIYHFEQKFRDEIRPRFGLMRSREFEMKDAYTFDADEESADKSYWALYGAYQKIFARCGLRFTAVEADSGTIGGSFSHEFMVLADTGEDAVVHCSSCGYGANTEKAELPDVEPAPPAAAPLAKVHTPHAKSVADLAKQLKVSATDIVKTMIFETDDGPLAVLVRGDHQVNEVKVKNTIGGHPFLAAPERIREITGGPVGFSGPVGLPETVRVVADYGVKGLAAAVVGANEADHHLVGAVQGRDFQVQAYHDLRNAEPGDPCPRCADGRLEVWRGIEVGHVFKLGTKYTKPMNATFLDQDGNEKLMIMGCYGIGPWRTLAAAIEQNHDDKGIIWPMQLAPFEVTILPLQMEDPEVVKAAEGMYQALADKGLEVLLDDRSERAGIKFNDADLMGIPLRLTISRKTLSQGKVEYKPRAGAEAELWPLEEAPERLAAIKSRMMAMEA